MYMYRLCVFGHVSESCGVVDMYLVTCACMFTCNIHVLVLVHGDESILVLLS